jgi:prepilin-type N-terminal cleavage/methylation domain-containing protein
MMPSRRAFTLVELIAVIVVLAILAGVAVPRFFDTSTRARAASIASSFKVIARSVIAYHRDNGAWPADIQPSICPQEILAYMEPDIWLKPTAVNMDLDFENWDSPQWEQPTPAVGISLRSWTTPTPTSDHASVMLLVDQQMDDGNLSTGRLQRRTYGYFMLIANK